MLRRRANRFLLVLAVLLNVSGGPVAFAHSAAAGHSHAGAGSSVGSAQVHDAAPVPGAGHAANPAQDAGSMSEHCAGHDSQSSEDPAPSGHSGTPCCAAGHCACSVASTVLSASAPAFVQFVRFLRPDDLRLIEPPSVSLRDPLRPPIV